MADLGKEFEALTSLHDDLAKQLNAFALVRLAILLACVLAFASAFERVGRKEIADLRNSLLIKVNAANDAISQEIVRGKYARIDVADPCLIGGENTIDYENKELIGPSGTAAIGEVESILLDLGAKCEQAYSPKWSLLGTDVRTDLRGWILALPFFLVFSELYFQIVSKKRVLIRKALELKAKTNTDDAGLAGRLVFKSGSNGARPFLKYPSAFLEGAYAAGTIVLVLKFIVDSRPFWAVVTRNNLVTTLEIPLVLFAYYCLLAYVFVSRQLQARFADELQLPIEVKPQRTFVVRLNAAADWLRLNFGARRKLIAGSVLTLLTLYLSTAVKGCAATPTKGALLLRTQNDVRWPTASLIIGNGAKQIFDILGHAFYWLGLTVALVTLLWLVLDYSKKTENEIGTVKFLGTYSASVALFAIADFSFGVMDFAYDWAALVAVLLVWLGLLAAWLWWGPVRGATQGWQVIRRRIIILCAPLVPMALLTLAFIVIEGEVWGYGVYLLGVCFLWRGYAEELARRREDRSSPLF